MKFVKKEYIRIGILKIDIKRKVILNNLINSVTLEKIKKKINNMDNISFENIIDEIRNNLNIDIELEKKMTENEFITIYKLEVYNDPIKLIYIRSKNLFSTDYVEIYIGQ